MAFHIIQMIHMRMGCGSHRTDFLNMQPWFLRWIIHVQLLLISDVHNPTSPLGLGGLGWGVCVYLVLALLGEVYLSPYPSPWAWAVPAP